jgi:hypothetical protein
MKILHILDHYKMAMCVRAKSAKEKKKSLDQQVLAVLPAQHH